METSKEVQAGVITALAVYMFFSIAWGSKPQASPAASFLKNAPKSRVLSPLHFPHICRYNGMFRLMDD
jgi:hypothetical protein